MTPPEEALAALLGLLSPVAPVRLAPADAIGRVLAEDLRALKAVPDRPVALVEGWAVRAAETLGAGPYAPAVLLTTPCRVAPGDTMPAGCDAVLGAFEMEDGPLPQALQRVAPGEGVRGIGEDLAAGACLRMRGERLTARDLPGLAALGVADVSVRVPRVGMGGDGFLAELVRGEGCETADTLTPTLSRNSGRGDAKGEAGTSSPSPAVAGGGLSLLLLATPPTGFHPLIFALAARPGTPTAIGTVHGTPAILLPRSAEDRYAAWILLIRPALRHLAGAPPLATSPARLARKVASTIGLAELVPLRITPDGLADPLAAGAVPLAALSRADAVLVVPPGIEGYDTGSAIHILPP